MESIDSYKYTASICCIYKNESLHIIEWIEYHRLIGIQHFYLYNNRSDDNIPVIYKDNKESDKTFREAFIQYYTEIGLLTHHEYNIDLAKTNFAALQNDVDYPFNHCSRTYKSESHWIAYIDLDEFIAIKNGEKNIVNVLNNNFSHVDGICLNSMVFGSSGHYFNPDGLIIDSYNLHRQFLDPYVKYLVKPVNVITHNGPHVIVYKENSTVADGSSKIISPHPVLHGTKNPILVLHHYASKSLWYWLRIKLRRVFSLKDLQNMESHQQSNDPTIPGTLRENYTKSVITWQNFNNAYNNAIYDNFMKSFIESILKSIELLPFYNISTQDFDSAGLNPKDKFDQTNAWIDFPESKLSITNTMKNYFLFGSKFDIKNLIIDVTTSWFAKDYIKAISSNEMKLNFCNVRFPGIFYHGWYHGFITNFHNDVIKFYIHLIYGNLPNGFLGPHLKDEDENEDSHQWFVNNFL
jgi:hypothetical protein